MATDKNFVVKNGLTVGTSEVITSAGNLTNIGTITSSGNLHAGDGTNISMDSSANGQLEVDGNGYQGAIALDGSAMYLYHNSSSRDLVLGTNETARLTIGGTGTFDFNSNNLQSIGTISSGAITSSGTITAPIFSGSLSGTASQANNLNAIDDRDIAPEDLGYADDFRIYFADKGGLETGTIGANYQDVLVLNSYSDSSGGDANALAFDKSEKKIYHYQADQAATNWGTAKTLAYIDDNITGTAAGLSGTPNITVGTISSGAITSSGNLLLDSASAEINLKSGIGTESGAINWTFNTTGTNYASIKLPYDTRATTGLHIDSGYPITIDATTRINFAISGTTRYQIEGTSLKAGGQTVLDSGTRNLTNIGTISSGAITATSINGGSTVEADAMFINTPDGGGAPAMTALLRIYGYEGRGAGIKIRDSANSASGASNREWFIGSGYNQSLFNIGYSATGSQSSYSAQNKLSIDTSGNATFAGTISSGAITSTGNLLVNGITAINKTAVASAVALTINSDASTTSSYGLEVCNATSNTRLLVDGVGNTSFYGSNNAITARFTSDNLFQIGGTTVIDASRNITAGTISTSGNINVQNNGILDVTTLRVRCDNDTGYSTPGGLTGGISLWSTGATTSQIMFKPTSAGSLGNHGFCTDSYNTYFVMDTTNRGWVFRNHTTATNVASISNNGGASFNNGIKINATTIVDSSANLTNIGTINSGRITATNGIEVQGVWVNNNQPSANNAIYSGYGAIGNRATFYITNGGGVIQIGNGAAHAVNPTATFSTTTLNLGASRTFQMNGQTVLDASRNLINIANISATGTGTTPFTFTGTSSSLIHKIGSATQTSYTSTIWETNDGYGQIWKTGSTYTAWGGADALNIYNSNGNISFHPSATQSVLQLTSTAINATKPIQISGTTVIDTSRNITAGTISSGAITTLGTVTVDTDGADAMIDLKGDGSYDSVLRLRSDQGDITTEGFEIWYDNSVGDVHLNTTYPNDAAAIHFQTRTGAAKSTANKRLTINGNGNVDVVSGSLRMGTTAVIDSSRNFYAADIDTSGDIIIGETGAAAYNTNANGVLYFGDDDLADHLGYSIGTKRKENIGGDYTKLNIDWHTGITLGASQSYGGVRFFNNSVGHYNSTTKLFSVGEGSSDVKVYNDLNVVSNIEINGTTVIDASRNGVFERLRADGGNLIMGNEAYSTSTSYVGMKTSFQSGSNDYMIISGLSDGETYVSAKDGSAATIRGGGNNSSNQITVPDGTTITATTSDFRVTGNVTAYASDERLKTNIQTIKNPIEKIKKIRGVEFDWLENIENFNPKFEHETGVIAQEIEAVIPDAVSPAPFNEEYKTVDKEKIVALLIEGMKEQQELIEKLTARIEELEK
jgi:hypothetical protein